MRIAGVESTDLFVGTVQRPLQVMRVTLENDGPASTPDGAATVYVQGPGTSDLGPFGITGLNLGERKDFEIPVEIAAPYQPGSTRRVTVTVETESGRTQAEADLTVAEPGWTMWMVSHFHYDPVWWNTQGQFAEARLSLPDEDGQMPDVRAAFELVSAHLDKARKDDDYKFVLAEIDYLKPYFDAFPQDRHDLRALLAEGRVEIVGGNYNEPSTNLISPEAIIRNAVYGIGFQRDVVGGDPRSAWMLDVFGHDPGYPGLMAAAGLTSSSWARGPFHQWGPSGAEGGGDRRMQFSTEFEWISPDGRGLLTAYMAHHYGAGWQLHTLPDLQAAEAEAYGQFRGLAQVAATRNVLLPVGSDHVIPARWVTDIHRDWNQRYVWPRFTTAVPREFFAAVRAEAGSGSSAGAWITPQTRDMNPVYTGKDVSYIDTKQAQRAIETAVSEGERLATLAWLAGAPFPHAALDKAWRLLAYGAHHDGITGVESDQVYLDLLGGWREAWELGSGARRAAVAVLSGSGLAGSGEPAQAGQAVRVFNGLARPRAQMATVTVPVPDDGTRWVEVRDDAGHPVPALAEGVRRRADGSLAEVTLTFLARGVPALGCRTYRVVPAEDDGVVSGWREVADVDYAIENGRYVVTADPARGGTVSVTDKRTGARVLAGPGNELVIQDEYAQHPKHGEGPWHLSPKGPGTRSSSVPAAVRTERCPAGSRLVASFTLDGLEVTQETVLWEDAERVEFRTHVDGYREKDRLLRVRFPADVPGGLPVYQTATAVIGRSFGAVDVDSADHWYTLDNPAHQWFGLGSTARVLTGGAGGTVQAIGVAEVVCPDSQDSGLRAVIRDLMVALAAAGVTATCSQAGGSRYGGIDADSNLPDVRIAVGGPEVNAFTAEVLIAAAPGSALAGGRVWVPAARSRAEAFAPSADVRGTSDLPVLIVAGSGPGELAAAVTALAEDLADALVTGLGDTAPAASEAPLADRSVALLNRGTPSGVVTPDGTLHMSLMRSCSGWPSRIWIDGDPRTAPDGSSFAWQHWSHTFEYALASGPGDWRAAGLQASAEDYNHPLITVAGAFEAIGWAGADGGGLLSVEPGNVTLSALKPRGNPLASERSPARGTAAGGAGAGGEAEVTVRLRETSGRPATARVRLAQPVSAAWLTDLLEESDGAALPVVDGTVIVDMPAFDTVTLVLRTGPGGGGLAAVEPVQPVYARYWLHGKGPAPAGNLPVAVHFSPTRVALAEPGEAGLLTLTVGCGPEPASGTAELVLPDGITVTAEQDLRYELAPGGYAAWDLTVRAAPGTGPGRYFAAARIRDEHGHVIEDTAMVAVGERRWPDPALPPEEALEAMQADFIAAGAEMDLAVLTPELRLTPGSRDEVRVRVSVQLASEAHGEAQLVSPFGTWDLVSPPAQGFSVTAREPAVLRFGVTVPATARPGTRSWALAKVMYFGRVRYSQAIPITIVAG
ncbi:MAG TPA: glycoside hydrolase family 38 C-terminal domain-containing protein [Streptosporangiaceae bacterium]|nr:glycoside hydrolase family 38 C-terminal domain-containing protein [Streptosporangiaceae bacterium]